MFIDESQFTSSSEEVITTLEKELHPDADERTLMDNFEYDNQEALASRWFGMNKYEYENLYLSDDVSSEGGSHSMKLDYKGYQSPGYAHFPTIGSDVLCRAISFDMKGDGVATVYLNFYIKTGNTTRLYRKTFSNVADGWNRYVVGFSNSNFSQIEGATLALGDTSIQNLYKFSFGIVNNNSSELSSIYVDNIAFLNKDVAFKTNTVTPLA